MSLENSESIPASAETPSPVQRNRTIEIETSPQENRSTGPKSAIGKRISSRNALKHGMFSKEIIREHLDRNDRKRYTEFLDGLLDTFKPEGEAELFQVELMAIYRHKYLGILRLNRALRGDATREKFQDIFVRGSDSNRTERWRLDVPPLDLLEKFHRAESHCLHHYNRAAAELERLQRLRLGDKVLPRITVDVNTA